MYGPQRGFVAPHSACGDAVHRSSALAPSRSMGSTPRSSFSARNDQPRDIAVSTALPTSTVDTALFMKTVDHHRARRASSPTHA